ncbi:UNVERIFIED_CONTAM: hypothetical protein GTU68_039094 [Idotea baltica]|nr:hypothetical protein [Idotea baltica]
MSPIHIIHHDDHCVAVDKPAGLLVHRSNIDRHETDFAMQIVRDQIGKTVYPVHRLDKATSGVLLFALSPNISAKLCEDFRERRIKKTYTALVRGHCDESGVLDRPLANNPTWKRGKFAEAKSEPQEAETHFQKTDQCEVPFAIGRYPTSRYSLVQLKPTTGRRHQIRRHLKHASHPIIGDTTHGDHRHNHFFKRELGLDRMMLVASELEFIHPETGQQIRLAAAPGDEFDAILDRIGLTLT